MRNILLHPTRCMSVTLPVCLLLLTTPPRTTLSCWKYSERFHQRTYKAFCGKIANNAKSTGPVANIQERSVFLAVSKLLGVVEQTIMLPTLMRASTTVALMRHIINREAVIAQSCTHTAYRPIVWLGRVFPFDFSALPLDGGPRQ